MQAVVYMNIVTSSLLLTACVQELSSSSGTRSRESPVRKASVSWLLLCVSPGVMMAKLAPDMRLSMSM